MCEKHSPRNLFWPVVTKHFSEKRSRRHGDTAVLDHLEDKPRLSLVLKKEAAAGSSQ